MPQYFVAWAASIGAKNEDEAKMIARELMRDPDPFGFHHEFGATIELDE